MKSDEEASKFIHSDRIGFAADKIILHHRSLVSSIYWIVDLRLHDLLMTKTIHDMMDDYTSSSDEYSSGGGSSDSLVQELYSDSDNDSSAHELLCSNDDGDTSDDGCHTIGRCVGGNYFCWRQIISDVSHWRFFVVIFVVNFVVNIYNKIYNKNLL